MQLVTVEELATKQATEDTQSESIRLTDACRCGQPETDLSEHDTTHNGQHEPKNHTEHIVKRTRTDGLVNKPLAKQYHQQSQCDLHNACHNTDRRIPADATRVCPQPDYVLHAFTTTDYAE